MSRLRAVLETVHLTALGLWLGTIAMSGVAAAIIFPKVKELAPHLPAYEKYTGDHAMLAAGHIANKVFVVGDVIQYVCATLCIVTMAGLLFKVKVPMNRSAGMVRLIGLVAALGIFGFSAIYLRTRMEINLRGYWEAALVGNNDEAARFYQLFIADHPLASNLMKANLVAVLLTMVGAAWVAVTPGFVPAPAEPRKPSKYQEPALLKGGR